MKREFEYFFFENFDADKEAENPHLLWQCE